MKKIPRLSGLTDDEIICLINELEAILEFEHDQEPNPKFVTVRNILQKVHAERLYRMVRDIEKSVKKIAKNNA